LQEKTMSYSQDIMEELHALKREAAQKLNRNAEEWQQIAREKAHSLAEDVKTLAADIRNALAVEEAQIERAVAGHAVSALASALAIGIALGLLLRRRP
jgi:proline racemase